jgi:hypothetical protein
MITMEQAMRLHQRSIEDYGGSPGVRDEAACFPPLAVRMPHSVASFFIKTCSSKPLL